MENKNIDILELLETQETILETNTISQEIFPEDTKNFDILSEIEEIKENNDILENIQISQELSTETKKQSFFSSFLYNIFFIIKYIWTSTLIFAILLTLTNYSAYIEIARSYINPESLEQNKISMLASVNQASIVKTSTWEINDTEEIQKDENVYLAKNKTYHSMDKLINKDYIKNIDVDIEIVPYENRIIIPKIWKNIPLLEVQNKTVWNVKELEDIFMKELVNGIVRYPWSARPGELWNSFIFGHSSNFPWVESKYNDVFALLDNVVFWDEIIAYYWQKKYTYRIKEKKIVKPGDVSILKRNNWVSEISLMTCWPVWTTLNRMIVIWELVK